MNGILAKKLGMTRIFTEEGDSVPVTVLEAGPCTIVLHRTKEKDGYTAVQVAFGEQKVQRTTKAYSMQFKHLIPELEKDSQKKPDSASKERKTGSPWESPKGVLVPRYLCEFEAEDMSAWPVGKTYDAASIFKAEELIKVTGVSKGHGFSGGIKRHGFHRRPESHGVHDTRGPGSLGAHTYPGRVFPGKRMPGHFGNKNVTIKNIQIEKIDAERNLIYVRGAVPGPKNGIIVVRKG
ncbi:MAG: 50S ribosomal protein L3 [Fibromonadaceae bacterium]|jgi:large subunit ribosomal protein L3|nr:50S ribosomal protein L3 [Fibromonadaceae bacterium]